MHPVLRTRVFTMALADSHQASEVPRIAKAFAARFSRATLRVVTADYLAATDGLTTGDVDGAFAPEQAVESGMHSRPLFEERATLLVRRDHPQVGPRMTRELCQESTSYEVRQRHARGRRQRVARPDLPRDIRPGPEDNQCLDRQNRIGTFAEPIKSGFEAAGAESPHWADPRRGIY